MHKREEVLGGGSVWYSDDEAIPQDLEKAFQNLNSHLWQKDSRERFVKNLTRLFQPIWKVHPFREGNGRSMRLWLDAILKKERKQVIDWNCVEKDGYLLAMERSPVKDTEIKAL